MHVTAIQLDIAWENKPANFERVCRLVAAARPEVGGLVVLPEMFATGFSMDVARIHEGPEREAETFLAGLAREHSAYVIGGVVTLGPDGRGRNEAVAFGPDGCEIARYAKMHPFSFGGEPRHYAAGDRIVTSPLGEFTAALTICYDLRFPELYRAAVLAGADLLVVIANWPAPRAAHWAALLAARAIENQAYVVGVNRCGSDPKHAFSGHSRIIDPRGTVIADAGEREGSIRASLDLEALKAYRREFPALADIRKDLIGGR
ncbi:MAG: carbon-nitrogen family hydrolase [Planctomycetota bacterium]|nr:carbon-nitrogen family hydrolase [Planctomycetota bacterium]